MGEIMIAVYRPKPGHADDLLNLVREHGPTLKSLDLVTDRPPTAMRAEDGTILEIFEWKDGAVAAAHDHPKVAMMWRRFEAVCDYLPLRDLPESKTMFAHFAPIDL